MGRTFCWKWRICSPSSSKWTTLDDCGLAAGLDWHLGVLRRAGRTSSPVYFRIICCVGMGYPSTHSLGCEAVLFATCKAFCPDRTARTPPTLEATIWQSIGSPDGEYLLSMWTEGLLALWRMDSARRLALVVWRFLNQTIDTKGIIIHVHLCPKLA